MNPTSMLLGYAISADSLEGVIGHCLAHIDSGSSGKWVSFINPHSLMVAERDLTFANALKDATMRLPDGTGIVLARRILGRADSGRITGFDFFQGISRAGRERQLRYFFLGGSEQVLRAITERIGREYPWITVVGSYSPPFADHFSKEESEKMLDVVNASRPTILWVGLTAPKQEKWIFEHKDSLRVPFIGAIGAVFDYYAGVRKRPKWACKLGLEWVVRLVQEPRRLWRRNVISMPLFVCRVIQREILKWPTR